MALSRQQVRKAQRTGKKAGARTARVMLINERRDALRARKLAKPKVVRTAKQVAQSAQRSQAQEANIRTRKTLARGERNRSILVEYARDGIEHSYHATKGWRHVRKDAV